MWPRQGVAYRHYKGTSLVYKIQIKNRALSNASNRRLYHLFYCNVPHKLSWFCQSYLLFRKTRALIEWLFLLKFGYKIFFWYQNVKNVYSSKKKESYLLSQRVYIVPWIFSARHVLFQNLESRLDGWRAKLAFFAWSYFKN